MDLILKFSSVKFWLVSLLIAIANYKIRKEAKSSKLTTLAAIFGLALGGVLILYFWGIHNWQQMIAIIILYILLAGGDYGFAKKNLFEQTSK